MADPGSKLATHTVTNQPPARGPRDLWASDPVLRCHAIGADAGHLARHGRVLGSEDIADAATEAHRVEPDLRVFDAGGRRLDEVRFAGGYHRLLKLGLGAGYAAGPWRGGQHTTHAAMVYLHSQVEPGTCCPMTMTYAAIPALAGSALAETWVPKLSAHAYDPSVKPIAQKTAATLGMAMTEKQGGSDVRANTTRAERADGAWRLTGHKWFCSAPMSDGFLTLAQAPGGLSCFLVPRWLPEGRNAIHLMRLKDKLGNRANASAEIEYHGARAEMLGDEGDGVRRIIEMVHHTRLDTAMAPAGLMRAAIDHLRHWVTHRAAFGRPLIDQPLMRNVLADLVLTWEAATALGFRAARAFDDPEGRAFARIAVALAKFLNNKWAVHVIAEALEALGGAGYVEDHPLAMLYREAPLNGIWEGAGNVICLDIRRSLERDPETAAALDAALDGVRCADAAYDRALATHRARWPGRPPEAEARAFADSAGRLLAAATLIEVAPPAVAEAYLATRITGTCGPIAGTHILNPAPLLARLA
ncbi:MAG: acyl-CoA dehydrogenase family protein [Pseudomonadota bacterium]